MQLTIQEQKQQIALTNFQHQLKLFLILIQMHFMDLLQLLVFIQQEVQTLSYQFHQLQLQVQLSIYQLGYQIVLGVDQSFGSYTTKSFTSSTTSPSITIEKNKFFLLPLCGFNDPNTDNLRLQKIFTITGDNLVYSVSQWYGQFTPCTFLEVQIPFGFITITKALKVSHLQIAAYEDSFQILNSNFQIKIKEINQIYQDYGTFQTVLDEITNLVNIDILIKCSKNNKITSKFNYCGTCSNQGRYEFNRSCYGSMNRYYLRSRFQTSFLAKKSLIITITSQNLLVTQLVYSDGSNSVQMQLDIIQMSLENV